MKRWRTTGIMKTVTMRGHELVLHQARSQQLSLESLASAADLQSDLIRRLIAYGVVEPIDTGAGGPWFDPGAVRRLRMVRRLRDDLGINLAGIAVAVDLVERIETLEHELSELRRRNRP
jgi:chaperone modulatory protein CbpM